MFLERKVKKTTKSPNKAEIGTWRRKELYVTSSLMDKEVDKLNTGDTPECFRDLTRDSVTKAVTFKLQETAKRWITRDDVRSDSRQSVEFYGGELTASDL